MKKWHILEDITVEKLVFGGKWFVRLDEWVTDSNKKKVLFITGWAVPGSIVDVKIIKKRKDYYESQIVAVKKKSLIETGAYELFPGAPWMNIDYNEQLKIKQTQIEESFFHVQKIQPEINFLPIIPAPDQFGYRNKIEFSFGKYISHKEEVFQEFNVGFHKRGEFSKVEDYDECLLIDSEQNILYKKIKDFAKQSWLPVHDQKMWTGFWRHILIRKTYFTNQTMVIFSYFPEYFENKKDLESALIDIKKFFIELAESDTSLSSIYLSHNSNKSDTVIGDMELIYGSEVITEELLGLQFDIGPKSFFQTNSRGAELLYTLVKDFSHKESFKNGTVLDLYGGTGTIGMIMSDIAKDVISVELNEEASTNGQRNAQKNSINNVEFINVKVEDFLNDYIEKWMKADLLIIDPPRAGMHPSAPENILKFNTKQIIYVSCNPATLARDCQYILENSDYIIEKVQAVDMFPHTHHIETVVSFIKKD